MFKNLMILLLLAGFHAGAQHYTPVDSASKVHFVIKNFGIGTGGDFTGLKGQIVFSPDDLNSCHFGVTVNAATVDTDNSMRDKNVAGEEYFDAAKFPVIQLVSTKIGKTNKTADGYYYFSGDLTIKGHTKAITFPFQAKKLGDGYLFTGSFELDRTEFGVGQKNMVLSNKVIVTLSVTAKAN